MLSISVARLRHLACICVFAACSLTAFPDEPAATLNAYMDASVHLKKFNGSVLVAKDDVTILSKGYGMANFEHEIANGPATKFRIGSITKQFTAMAVLILMEQGQLNVEDPVGEHLDDAPATWGAVTIHQLLTHTSGIPSYTNMPEYGRDMMLPQSVQQMVARFRDKPLKFTPGEQYRYSNSGYFLLGAIIESASGMRYDEFLRKVVFDPLDLHDTGYDRYKTVLQRRAVGYVRQSGEIIHGPYLDMSQPYSAGALYSTVEDLRRWDQALRDKRLISAESYAKMYTPEKHNYAYGWHVSTESDRRIISHGGGINGFRSHILRYPDEKLCVVVLCNIEPSRPERVARGLGKIALGDEYELPKQ